jgi:FtsP/CotA-like multicopper oxidase with cupredoxin domain
MKNIYIVKQLKIIVLIFASLALTATSVLATLVTLSAVEGEWTPPGTGQTPIPMWGFITDTGSCPASPVTWEEGPTIEVPFGEPSLTINVRNCLSEPVSVFIPGQQKALAPERLPADIRRVYSFDTTAPADNGATLTAYTWSNPKSGTYLYHSGTHIQVQVQMGLYGALVVQSTPPVSCGEPAAIANKVLLYSEIDPGLHTAIDTGTYGTWSYPSTFDYQPKYFLINGLSFPDTENITILTDQTTRLRFLNAGLKTHIPTIQGTFMNLEAEDGNPYPYKKLQYSIELTAAKTMDALISYGAAGRYALYDRSLSLTNAGVTGGGMLMYIDVDMPAP